MSSGPREHYDNWGRRVGAMRSAAPDIGKAFGTMFRSLMGEGALSVREKELIALGIGMALRCDECVHSHLEKAISAGATREQILEMAGVVVMMQGGPAYVKVPMLLEALEELEQRAQLAGSG